MNKVALTSQRTRVINGVTADAPTEEFTHNKKDNKEYLKKKKNGI